MKWVKASERLPSVPENASGLIIIREINDPNNYKVSWFGNHKGGRGGGSLLKKFPQRFEWLDQEESTPEGVTEDPRDEEIARLKELIEKLFKDGMSIAKTIWDGVNIEDEWEQYKTEHKL